MHRAATSSPASSAAQHPDILSALPRPHACPHPAGDLRLHETHLWWVILADPEQALDTIAREQLGLDPDDLGSPRAAAAASFASFTLGAVLP